MNAWIFVYFLWFGADGSHEISNAVYLPSLNVPGLCIFREFKKKKEKSYSSQQRQKKIQYIDEIKYSACIHSIFFSLPHGWFSFWFWEGREGNVGKSKVEGESWEIHKRYTTVEWKISGQCGGIWPQQTFCFFPEFRQKVDHYLFIQSRNFPIFSSFMLSLIAGCHGDWGCTDGKYSILSNMNFGEVILKKVLFFVCMQRKSSEWENSVEKI